MRARGSTPPSLGDVVVVEDTAGPLLAQVTDVNQASIHSDEAVAMAAGSFLEDQDMTFADGALRSYHVATLKPLVHIIEGKPRQVKLLPTMFTRVRRLLGSDLAFLGKEQEPLTLGLLRGTSPDDPVAIEVSAPRVLSHHVLIAATTGRGKSNLTSCLLADLAGAASAGVVVLDPHDEYYGRDRLGLKDHPRAQEKVRYYTHEQPPAGARSLWINIAHLRPHHFEGCVPWTDAQHEALIAYHRKYRDAWIESILFDRPVDGFMEATLGVLKRRVAWLLDVHPKNGTIECRGVFHTTYGGSTLVDIATDLEQRRVVIIDTSSLGSSTEILVGSIIAGELLHRQRNAKLHGTLATQPVFSIVLEEAPRVLGKAVLEQGPNIFSTIAREGRKFKIGLVAITQLPSMIPREILANMNTKIILGLEMKPERQAIIESAAQDLSEDDRHIASLDVGEAVITSHFVPFATPVHVPLFADRLRYLAQQQSIKQNKKEVKVDFQGVGIGT